VREGHNPTGGDIESGDMFRRGEGQKGYGRGVSGRQNSVSSTKKKVRIMEVSRESWGNGKGELKKT